MISHYIAIQAKIDGKLIELATFAVNNRYYATKEQRRQIAALKYENKDCVIIKRKEKTK